MYEDEPTPDTTNRLSATTGALVATPLALLVGGLGGLFLGVLSTALFLGSTPPDETVRAPTADEISIHCDAQLEEVDELTEVQTKVADLERSVLTKERAIQELESEMDRRASRGAALVAQLDQLKGELTTARVALKAAEQEKTQLMTELRATQGELKTTTRQRDQAREDAVYNRWEDFLKGAQLEICDKGNRKKLGNCRESVEAAIFTDDRRDRFSHCIRSGQAEPAVLELQKGSDLPVFAEMIDEEAKQTRGWMVLFCDPTLPESDDSSLATGRLPG